MTWILFALLSTVFWAVVNIGDKYAVANRFKSPYVFLSFTVYPGVVFLFFVNLINWQNINLVNLFLVALGAAFYFYGSLVYIKAVQIEEITRINILMSTIPVFSLVLSFVFLGEKLGGGQLLGFVFLLIGGFFASLHSKFFKGEKVAVKPLMLMLFASFCYGVYAVLFRTASFSLNFWDIFLLQGIFMFLYALTLFFSKQYRKSFAVDIKNFNLNLTVIILILVSLDFLGMLFNLKALSLQTASLVNAMIGFQTVFVFIISILISLKNKKILQENWHGKNIIYKLVALILMICGVLVLNL